MITIVTYEYQQPCFYITLQVLPFQILLPSNLL